MATLRVLIDTDNAVFEDQGIHHELARILRVAADKVEGGTRRDLKDGITLRDVNGNTVGRAQLVRGKA